MLVRTIVHSVTSGSLFIWLCFRLRWEAVSHLVAVWQRILLFLSNRLIQIVSVSFSQHSVIDLAELTMISVNGRSLTVNRDLKWTGFSFSTKLNIGTWFVSKLPSGLNCYERAAAFPYSIKFESTALVQIDMPGGKREKTEKNQSTLSGLFDCMSISFRIWSCKLFSKHSNRLQYRKRDWPTFKCNMSLISNNQLSLSFNRYLHIIYILHA